MNPNRWQELLLLAASGSPTDTPLNPQGWAIMLVSVASVVSMTIYCIGRVLKLPPADADDVKGPLAIDTGDSQDAD